MSKRVPKVVNIRGTSGSGKSYIVRSVMGLYQTRTSDFEEDRRQPIGYWCRTEGDETSDKKTLYVVGHYETACGGCDTIMGMDRIYDLIEDAILIYNADVIFEGLIVASDVTRCVKLNEIAEVLVVELSTPLDVCLASIQQRRDARGDTRPLSSTNTVAKMKQLVPQRKRFLEAGIDFRHLDRETALTSIKEHLEWR